MRPYCVKADKQPDRQTFYLTYIQYLVIQNDLQYNPHDSDYSSIYTLYKQIEQNK